MTSNRISWEELCQLEPRLRELERKAALKAGQAFVEDYTEMWSRTWYVEIKPELVKLVGDEREIPGYEFESEPKESKDLDEIPLASMDLPKILVGMNRHRAALNEHLKSHPEQEWLYTPFAYDVAYTHLLDVLEGKSSANN